MNDDRGTPKSIVGGETRAFREYSKCQNRKKRKASSRGEKNLKRGAQWDESCNQNDVNLPYQMESQLGGGGATRIFLKKA